MARIGMRGCSVVVLGFVFLTFLPSQEVHAVTCQEAITKMMPCLPFLKGYGNITVPCMKGAQSLNRIATTNPIRKAICECFKKLVARGYKVDVDRAKQLPQLSKTTLPFEVDPNVNCDKFSRSLRDGSRLDRPKKMEDKAFRPAAWGRSHGVGHGSLPHDVVPPFVVHH